MKNRIIEFANKYLKNKYILLFIGGTLWLVFFDSYSVKDNYEYGKKIISLKKEINYYQNQIKQSERKMNELESDKEGLERFAREEYLMKRENEDIFLFEEE